MQTRSTAPSAPTSPSRPADTTSSPANGIHLPSYLLGLLTALILLGAALLLWPRPQPAAMRLQPPPTPAPTPSPLPTAQPTSAPTPSPLVVFVSGAVGQPGLYTLAADARIGDAIAAAGGLLPSVDTALINQAQPLVDGAQVHVPAPALPPANPPAETALPTGAAAQDPGAIEADPARQTGNDASATAPLGPAGAQPPAGMSVAAPLTLPTPTVALTAPAEVTGRGSTVDLSTGSGLINVNSASSAALESLPSIGPAKAQAIIDNRPYATVEELDRVPGIGPATLEQIRPYVTTGEQ